MKRIKFVMFLLSVFACSASLAQTIDVRIPEYIFTEKAIYEVIDDYIKNKNEYAEIHFYEDKENSILFRVYLFDKIDHVSSNAYGFVKSKGTTCFLYDEKYAIKKKHKKRKFSFPKIDLSSMLIDPDFYVFKLHKKSGMIERVG